MNQKFVFFSIKCWINSIIKKITFGFLFDSKKLKLTNDDEFMVYCVNLQVFLKHRNNCDIDSNKLLL